MRVSITQFLVAQDTKRVKTGHNREPGLRARPLEQSAAGTDSAAEGVSVGSSGAAGPARPSIHTRPRAAGPPRGGLGSCVPSLAAFSLPGARVRSALGAERLPAAAAQRCGRARCALGPQTPEKTRQDSLRVLLAL